MTADYKLYLCINDFLFHCEFERQLCTKTLKAYQIDLMQFLRFFEQERTDIPLIEIRKVEIKSYLQSITNLKPKTVKRKIASLKAMLSFVEYEHDDYSNPFRRLKLNIKEAIRLPVTLSMSEMALIMKTVYAHLKTSEAKSSRMHSCCLRIVAVIELLFATGMRVSELCTLEKENINLNEGSILVKGKGRKERMLYLCHERVLDSLRNYRASLSSDQQEESAFFLNRHGRPIEPESVRRIVRNVAVAAGIDKHVTPHTFRHSFATLILEEGVDIRYIQAILGHSSIVTTQLYTRVNTSQQREIIKTKHPRLRMDI